MRFMGVFADVTLNFNRHRYLRLDALRSAVGNPRSEDTFQGFLAEWLPAQQLTLVVSPIETQ
jgi:hypothetical protein